MTVPRISHHGELLPATQPARQASRAAGHAAGAAFADVLAKTTKDAKPAEDVKLRKGETLAPVQGRPFAEIDGGRRDGLYVNTSGNVRHGQTFTMAIRHGRELHIYGTGADRVVVSVPVKRDRGDDAGAAQGTGGTSAPTVSPRS